MAPAAGGKQFYFFRKQPPAFTVVLALSVRQQEGAKPGKDAFRRFTFFKSRKENFRPMPGRVAAFPGPGKDAEGKPVSGFPRFPVFRRFSLPGVLRP
jgi:hypothetical protein